MGDRGLKKAWSVSGAARRDAASKIALADITAHLRRALNLIRATRHLRPAVNRKQDDCDYLHLCSAGMLTAPSTRMLRAFVATAATVRRTGRRLPVPVALGQRANLDGISVADRRWHRG